MSNWDDANALAVNGSGFYRQWLTQSSTGQDSRPSSDSDGVSLVNSEYAALSTIVSIDLRATPAYRTATLTIDTFDAGADYTVRVGEHTDTTSGNTDIPTTLDDIKTSLEGDSDINALVTVTVTDEDGDGDDDTLTLTGKDVYDFSTGFTATGSAVVSVEADPATARVTGWANYAGVTKAGTPASGWRPRPCWEWVPDWRGMDEAIQTDGLGRVFFQVEPYPDPGDGHEVTVSAPSVVVGASTQRGGG